jgi:hypothetical protein
MEAATKCVDSGSPHQAVANPWLYSVRAVQAVLPRDQDLETADDFLRTAQATQPINPATQ